MEVLDAVLPIERVKLNGELSVKVMELPGASALAKIGISARIAAIIAELGAGEPAKPELEIIEHTTGKGNVIRGVVRTDLTYQQAKAIDEYTFKKDGGYFIREKHLGNAPAVTSTGQPDRIKNFGWDAVKLSDLNFEQLAELRKQVEAEHANPKNEAGLYTENGAVSLYLYDKKGRWKLDRLAWAVAYKLGDKRAAENQAEQDTKDREQAEADRIANERLREEAKRKEQAVKMREAAAGIIEKAEAELNRDRLANTSRRAGMAASALARAESDRALGLTMQRLADAIESGQAQRLSGINSKAALVTLQDMMRNAMQYADTADKLSYSEQERSKGRPPENRDIAFAKFPTPAWGTAGTSLSAVLEAIKGKRGAPALADKIRYSYGPTGETIAQLKAIVGDSDAKYLIGWWNLEQVARAERLKRAGIANLDELKAALGEYLQFREGARAEDPIKKAERAILGQKVGIDFFPTPAATAQRMVELAGIQKGERVLEPSAGNGNLADAAKAAGAQVDVVEISSQLRDILTAKGHEVVAYDFDEFLPEEKYDAIIMNPPFSDRRDAAHIMRAFDMLTSGGRLVAIAGEGVFNGSDRKAKDFQEWLQKHSAEVEQLPQNTFMDKQLLATTGANARLLVMQRQ